MGNAWDILLDNSNYICVRSVFSPIKGKGDIMSARTISFEIYDNDGNSHTIELPAKYEVCGRCEGEGSHVNPNVECDGGGFTASEWNEACSEDPEFADHYFGGLYDIKCKECDGKRVVLVIDKDAIHTDEQKEDLAKLEKQREEEYACWCEREAERRMGC